MQIQITKQHTDLVHIPVPCFWKSYKRWIGVIDEKTLITFVNWGDRCEINSYELPDAGKIWLEATQEEGTNYELATEQEFFDAYDSVMKQLTIIPIFKTW